MQKNVDKAFTIFEKMFESQQKHLEKMFESQQKHLEQLFKSQEKHLEQREKYLEEREKDMNDRLALEKMKYSALEDEYKEKIQQLEEDLKEKESELEDLEALNQTLIVKELKSNDEVQEARKLLIQALIDHDILKEKDPIICVRMMGQLSTEPFNKALKRKWGFAEDEEDEDEEWSLVAAQLCSQWESYIKDPSWYPFIHVEGEEIVNEEDERLKKLKKKYGVEVHEAVKTALIEMNKYNPSAQHVVPELWNKQANRRAQLKDGVNYILQKIEFIPNKRQCMNTEINGKGC